MARIHESGFEPAQFLVKNIELLPKGRALTVAMGTGGFWFVGYAFNPETELYSKEKLAFQHQPDNMIKEVVKMAKATWNGAVLAESDTYEEVEGNVYFPPESVKWDYLKPGDRQYICPWKGETRYHDIVVGGKINKNAAWSYPEPKEAAKHIKGHVAFETGFFGKGVQVKT